ncbi:MAG: PEP-CTERM sorting domain-containing protein [Gammaproteobacteria bacterium]
MQLKLFGCLVPALALAGLFIAGSANAVPCGAFASVGGIKIGATDLGTSATTCRNGGIGDANDSIGDLNTGAFFGSTSWTELTKTDEELNTSFWSFAGQGTKNGTFSLANGLWNLYSNLVVVLKDGGSTTNRDIKWAAYLLPVDVNGVYDWSYDNRKNLSHATLYGVKGSRTSVPEPAALLLMAFGLGIAGLALRRRLSQIRL